MNTAPPKTWLAVPAGAIGGFLVATAITVATAAQFALSSPDASRVAYLFRANVILGLLVGGPMAIAVGGSAALVPSVAMALCLQRRAATNAVSQLRPRAISLVTIVLIGFVTGALTTLLINFAVNSFNELLNTCNEISDCQSNG